MTTFTHRHLASTTLVAVALFSATSARAADPDVGSLVADMKRAIEPAKTSLRKVTMTVAQDGATSTVVLGQARGSAGGTHRILTVVLAPADLRGTAYLVEEQPAGDADKLWVYVPAIGRVRTVVSPEAFSAFLNSDFTYADLGFISLRASYSLAGEATTNGTRAYRIDMVPSQRWYYTHVETAVAADSSLPIERKFYDAANVLWKVERFEQVKSVDGVATPLAIGMDDVQAKSRTSLQVTDLRYGAEVPATLLEPKGLAGAGASPVWTALSAPIPK